MLLRPLHVLRSGRGAAAALCRAASGSAWMTRFDGPMFQHQESLPRLPIPALDDTCKRFIDYSAPLLSSEQLEKTRALVSAFQQGVGRSLHAQLQTYARTRNSYIEEMWDDAYLLQRSSIVINTSPYLLLENDPSRPTQTARAARLMSAAGSFLQRVRSRTLAPDMEKTGALCMSQYDRVLATARIPGLRRDHLVTDPETRHAMVMVRGRMYTVDMLGADGAPLPAAAIQQSLEAIVAHARAQTDRVLPMGLLTSDTLCSRRPGVDRAAWAVVRPLLGPSLQLIDSAILCVCLDEPGPSDMESLSRQMLHADGRNRWFDKSVQLIVTADGAAGVCMEHAGYDGHSLLRLLLEMTNEANINQASGSTAPAWREIKLEGSQDRDVVSAVAVAGNRVTALINDNETAVLQFGAFGKRAITGAKLSPDAFAQMAFQLAYYRHHRSAASTYESCMTKNFYHGRTEAIRSVTAGSVAFVRAMEDTNLALDGRKAALVKAIEAHVKRAAECKQGQGVDRHLYAMYCLAKEQGSVPDLYTDAAWPTLTESVLSTSNVTHNILSIFGFGPVTPRGYGIGYIIKDDKMVFNVTSKHRETRVFVSHLERALQEMLQLANATA